MKAGIEYGTWVYFFFYYSSKGTEMIYIVSRQLLIACVSVFLSFSLSHSLIVSEGWIACRNAILENNERMRMDFCLSRFLQRIVMFFFFAANKRIKYVNLFTIFAQNQDIFTCCGRLLCWVDSIRSVGRKIVADRKFLHFHFAYKN